MAITFDSRTHAIEALHAMRRQFGWAIVVFNDKDIVDAADRDLTEDDIAKVQDSWYWHHLEDHMIERGWDFVHNALSDAGIHQTPEPEEAHA